MRIVRCTHHHRQPICEQCRLINAIESLGEAVTRRGQLALPLKEQR